MRAPAELYAILADRRREYGPAGMLVSYTDLTPPLDPLEARAVLEWMDSGEGPRHDYGMVAVLQNVALAELNAARRADRAARSVQWRFVSGGRAAHAFRQGDTVPLCGVVPAREHGLPVVWRREPRPDYRTLYSAFRKRRGWHRECVWRAERKGLIL